MAKNLVAEVLRAERSWHSSTSLSRVLLEEIAKGATGVVGKIIISTLLRQADETAERLDRIEEKLDYIRWQHLVTGIRRLKQAYGHPTGAAGQMERRERLIDEARNDLELALTQYAFENVRTSDVLDVRILIAICHGSCRGGEEFGHQLLLECAQELWGLANDCDSFIEQYMNQVKTHADRWRALRPGYVCMQIELQRKTSYLDLMAPGYAYIPYIPGKWYPGRGCNQIDREFDFCVLRDVPEAEGYFHNKEAKQAAIAAAHSWWVQRIGRIREVSVSLAATSFKN